MGDGRRRAALTAWLANDLPTRFAERILSIDHAIAERWDELMAQSRRSGVALFAMDGFFAATTLANNLDAGHAQPQRFRVIRRRAVQPMGRMSFVELHRLKYGPKLWVRHRVASRAIAAS
jgi:predicted nucleic acid-binding protein